ncbi:ATP/maltotriose-dependent transcriptional regulator MalT [Kitasatospora gansuensis]|uniref:ATP/maltotriose-dependent transcriptional regulator MalT n=1 Tax=Kitasatospora gansuensis TaxID=258050 RepID=A0A7W7SJJ5_9ACTN|nr:LuxR family transcriptional regulator [Kitasatospora gansuensis]MBB4951307.1 ATP/maltotriose-dependent transcriptional regulator MalT [Kitasatospora gansuensis]
MARPSSQDPVPAGGRFTFVGRRRELGLLLAAVRHPPAVVLIEGEAGIGKSRLVREATATLAPERHCVLTGYCQPLREPFPYGPVFDALAKAGPWLPGTGVPPTAGALAPLLPDLADRLPSPPMPPPDGPQAERHQLVRAVRSLLGVLGPAVLVVEDMHWVDDATRELLLLIARDLPDQLSLVLTYRAEDLPPRTPVLGSAYRHPPGTSGTTITLAPLTEADVAELATGALGSRATPVLARALYGRSEGLPLVAEEDLISLDDQGRRGGTADAVAVLERAQVPRGLREAVTERLAGLSPPGAAVVDAAAVLAVPADEPLLTAVAGLDPEQGALGLTEALRLSVLREDEDGRYGFRHVLAQQVAYRNVPGPQRTRLHQRAVEELERHSPQPLVQIAHHTLALGDREAWFRRAEAAADQAVALGDTGTAAALLRRILEQPHLGDDLRSRAALALARIAVDGIDHVATIALLRRLIADPQQSESTRGDIRLALGLLMVNHGGNRAGFREVRRSVEELATRPDRAARAMIAMAMYERDGASDQARDWMDRAEQTVRGSADDAIQAAVHATRLTLLARQGDPAVWPQLDRLPRAAAGPEVLRQTARALYNVGDIAIELGHDRRARTLLTESRDLARRSGTSHLECYSRIALLRLNGLAGHWDGLEEDFAALDTAHPDIAMTGTEQALILGQLATAKGQRSRAIEQFTLAADYGKHESQVTAALRAASGLAAVRLAQGAPEDARAVTDPAAAMLRRAAAWARATGVVPVAIEAALACGDHRFAEQLADDAEQGLRDADAPAADAELRFARGLLHSAAEPAAAAEHFLQAEHLWQEIGRPYEAARAAECSGRALAASRPDASTAHLTEALDTFTRLGATADAARCRHTLDRLGLVRPPTRGRRGYGDRLSPREHQVAELLAQGATNQDIAEALFLSPRTVERHVAHVLKKLDATRKTVSEALPGHPTD